MFDPWLKLPIHGEITLSSPDAVASGLGVTVAQGKYFLHWPRAKWEISTFHRSNAHKLSLCGTGVNSLRPRQNGRHFSNDIFKYIFLNENVLTKPKFSLKFVPKVRIDNIPASVQVMAWRRPGDKPLSEPMMVSLYIYICVTRPQWDTIMGYGNQMYFKQKHQPIIELWHFIKYYLDGCFFFKSSS